MEKNKKNNFKKLLCYNIVNNMKCVYKNKCMFAHNINEQLKEPNREFIYNMIYGMGDLSNINIKENKELFEELMIFTKECKNCINKKCPGGYNCKFGVCVKNLKICYNDLLNGKCILPLEDEHINNKIIKRCSNGIHLTEKNLIPFYQRVTCEINVLDYGVFLFNNINYYSKINTLSILLNDNTIKLAKNLINKNKINKNDIFSGNIFEDKYSVNFLLEDDKNVLSKNKEEEQDIHNINDDDNFINEYQSTKNNYNIDEINEYFWRFNELSLFKKDKYSSEYDTNKTIDDDSSINNQNYANDSINLILEHKENLNEQIKNLIKMITETDITVNDIYDKNEELLIEK